MDDDPPQKVPLKPKAWKERRMVPLIIGPCLVFLLANVVANRHAYRFSHYATGGRKTALPEELNWARKAAVLIAGVNLPRPTNLRTPAAEGLPFEAHSFGGAFGIPLEAWLIRHPKSRGLVLMFHGYAGKKADLLPAAKEFRRFGYSALLVDFHGSGGSGGDSVSIGYHEADDVLAAVRYSRTVLGEPEPILYGISMGAAAVLRAIHVGKTHPKAVIVEAPFDRMLSTTRNRFKTMGIPSFPWAELLVIWGGLQGGFKGFSHNPASYARSVECPTLLMFGNRDNTVSVSQSRTIFAALPGKREKKVFNGLGHVVFVEERPSEWRASVWGFLDDL